MNANRIINMVIRMVTNRLIRGGVNAGINKLSQRGKNNAPSDGDRNTNSRQKTRTADTQKRMRQSMRVARKMGRF